MTNLTKKKLKIIAVGGGVLIASYGAIKYLLPLIWPFILAYGLAVLIFPVVRFLRDKLHFHKNAAAGLTLAAALCIMSAAITVLADKVFRQIKELAANWPTYEEKIMSYLRNMCGVVEKTLKIDDGQVYGIVCDGVDRAIDGWQGQIMPTLMNNSLNTLLVLIDVLIVIVLTIMAVFYMARDMDNIRKTNDKNLFYKEISFCRNLVSKAIRAYIKSQLIIMSIIAVICSVGLAIVGNRYYILLGIVIGVLDALPLIGVGAIMVPWSIVYIFTGHYLNAAIMLTLFIVCYFVREFLEPKLMGQSIGMSPIASLISIYVGYQLFGFLGMIAGPLVYVLVREVIVSYNSSQP